MRIKLLSIYILTLSIGCNFNSDVVVPGSIKFNAPHEFNYENLFAVGDKLVLINNSGDYLFDYYQLPNISYIGSFGQLSRDADGFSMIPSTDLIKVISDTSFISDNRIVTFSSSMNSVNISSFFDPVIVKDSNIDSILNSKISSKSNIYSRSDVINGKIYSLLYKKKKNNNINIWNDIPELHLFDTNYNLLDKFTLSHPLITFTISNKYNKIYTLAADNNNLIIVYDLPPEFGF